MSVPGRILHVQRLSTEDGPGLRSTVFLKGCPLRCPWCHNPESISPRPQLQWLSVRCIGCGTCVRSCPAGCLSLTDQGVALDRARCAARQSGGAGRSRGADGSPPPCSACSEACPAGALEVLGRVVDSDALLGELLRDRAYFGEKGGVTLSGGEPTAQVEFSEALLSGLKAAGVSAALDTCGHCPPGVFERLLPLCDLVLFDLKLADPEEHRRHTGSPNGTILENLVSLGDRVRGRGAPAVWIRTPLVPGATDSEENLRAIGGIIAGVLGEALGRWELCAFNNLCADKYTRLGYAWDYASVPLMARGELLRCERAAKSSGVDPSLVSVTGAARAEERGGRP